MNLSFSQHVLNRPLMESIANYFQSPNKIYPHGPNSIQITLRGKKKNYGIILYLNIFLNIFYTEVKQKD